MAKGATLSTLSNIMVRGGRMESPGMPSAESSICLESLWKRKA